MKNLKLNEIEKQDKLEILDKADFCNVVGGSVCSCCGDSGSTYREVKKASKTHASIT